MTELKNMGINSSPSVVSNVSNGLRDCSAPGFGGGVGESSTGRDPNNSCGGRNIFLTKPFFEKEIYDALLGLHKYFPQMEK